MAKRSSCIATAWSRCERPGKGPAVALTLASGAFCLPLGLRADQSS